MKFRKKPVVIEAEQFTTNNEPYDVTMNRIVAWILANGSTAYHDSTDIYIATLEGTMKAEVGDWIIRGVKGEFYPCKPDIFATTYEPFDALTDSTGGGEKIADYPDADGTDAAHPAWWRGNDRGCEAVCTKVLRWLRGEDLDSGGKHGYKPLDEIRNIIRTRDNSEWNAAIQKARVTIITECNRVKVMDLSTNRILDLLNSLSRPEAEKSVKNQADGEEPMREPAARGAKDCPEPLAGLNSPSALEELVYEAKIQESNSILKGRHGIVFDRALADERKAASTLIAKLKQDRQHYIALAERTYASLVEALQKAKNQQPDILLGSLREAEKRRDSARAEAIRECVETVKAFFDGPRDGLVKIIDALDALKAPK